MSNIVKHKPKVLFIDVVIPDRPTTDIDGLAKVIVAAKSSGVQTILAQLQNDNDQDVVCLDNAPIPPKPDVPNSVRLLGGALAPKLACAAGQVAPIAWHSPFRAIYYPLSVRRSGRDPAVISADPSPGMAVAQAMTGGDDSELSSLIRGTSPDMFLAWSWGSTPAGGDCSDFHPDSERGFFAHAWLMLHVVGELLNLTKTDDDQYCTYIPSMSADDLTVIKSESMDHVQERQWARVDAAIRNHAVLVGIDLAGRGDSVEPPIGGELPGVFVHATAVENLLTLGASHFHSYDPPRPGLPFIDVALLTFIMFAMGALRWTGHRIVTTIVPIRPPHGRFRNLTGSLVASAARISFVECFATLGVMKLTLVLGDLARIGEVNTFAALLAVLCFDRAGEITEYLKRETARRWHLSSAD